MWVLDCKTLETGKVFCVGPEVFSERDASFGVRYQDGLLLGAMYRYRQIGS
jgi:hypothetical protein